MAITSRSLRFVLFFGRIPRGAGFIDARFGKFRTAEDEHGEIYEGPEL